MLMEKAATLLGDLRFAFRSLGRAPGFVAIAILTLGLGVGANTSAFSVMNEVFLRPLPYPESGQLDRIYRAIPQNSRGGVSPADYLDLKPQAQGYGQVAAYAFADMNLSAPGEPAEMARGLRVTADLFPTLGVEPEMGRGFTAREAQSGAERVILLSHPFWVRRFGSDPHIVGRTVRVDGETYAIVGVLPEAINDWRHLGSFDLFRPLALTEKEAADRGSHWLRIVGRRSRDVTRAQADAFFAGFGSRLAAEYPAIHGGATWHTLPLNRAVAPDNGPAIFAMLIGLSTFVLIIGCSNLANLLLARTMARAREFAVRGALGASRLRLLRPLFVESLLLALGGGVAALYLAMWTGDWLRHYGTTAYGGGFKLAIDWRVLGWAMGAGLFTAVVFGIAPALFALRLDLNKTLKSGGRGTTGSRGHQRFRNALIVGQFAMALVLLTGAAVFVRGIQEANTRAYGWKADRLVTATMHLPESGYPSAKEIAAFQRLALDRLEALPGVASASVSYTMPFFGLADPRKYVIGGRETPKPGQEPVAGTSGVSPHYFDTVSTRLLDGRAFAETDSAAAARVYIVNETMARGLFGTESPLGRRIAQAGGKTIEWGEIVGVVGDTQSVFPDQVPVPYQIYEPMAQEPRAVSQIAVRTTGATPGAMVDSIRAAMATLDADLPLRELEPADVSIARANYSWQVLGKMLSFLATLGLFLASMGMYGVIARTMAQRTGEFGIRLALGALASDITRLVLASGARLALIGSALGLFGAFGLTRVLASTFPAMRTSNGPVLAGTTLLLVAIALFACYVPARRASRISLTDTLRAE
jgi:putative ABC transport system permease protein